MARNHTWSPSRSLASLPSCQAWHSLMYLWKILLFLREESQHLRQLCSRGKTPSHVPSCLYCLHQCDDALHSEPNFFFFFFFFFSFLFVLSVFQGGGGRAWCVVWSDVVSCSCIWKRLRGLCKLSAVLTRERGGKSSFMYFTTALSITSFMLLCVCGLFHHLFLKMIYKNRHNSGKSEARY